MNILLHAGVCVRLLCVGGVGVGARSLEGASVEVGQSQIPDPRTRSSPRALLLL